MYEVCRHLLPGLANVGTPLLWASMGWLLVGNVAIGWLESRVLQRMGYPVEVGRMVAANYASAALGVAILFSTSSWLPEAMGWLVVRAGYAATALPWLAAFALTLPIEVAFVRWAMPTQGWRLAWRATTLANVVSYAALILLSVPMSGFSLAGIGVSSAGELEPDAGRVYSQYGREIRRCRLDGGLDELVDTRPGRAEFLSVEPSADGLRAQLWAGDPSSGKVLIADLGRPEQAAIAYTDGDRALHSVRGYLWVSTRAFRAADMRGVRDHVWPEYGIGVRVQRRERSFALGAPAYSLAWRGPLTVLPNGAVVGCLGSKVVLLDPEKSRLAILAEGTSPTVLLDSTPARDGHFSRFGEKALAGALGE